MRLGPWVASVAVLPVWLYPSASASRVSKLSEVHAVYVDSFGTADGADLIREDVIHRN
jgi:hypothetical protein